MKPRIFICSTCYDLKFVREDLADFVRVYGYEPILSENGDIGYTPGQDLDKSCYAAAQTADMVILIIGSEYGSAASGEKKKEFEEYISITRNEFRAAMDAGIPIFTMIDKKVMAEYGIYEENIEEIEKKSLKIKFKITKNLNVFRFIKEIKNSVALPIQEFEKSADIKGFISKQWADMFKSYLSSLRNEKENRKIESSVNEMKDLIQKMNIMLDSVGKNVLTKENPEKYQEVVNQQEILSFCNVLVEIFKFSIIKPIEPEKERKRFIGVLLNNLKKPQDINSHAFTGKLFRDLQSNGYTLSGVQMKDSIQIYNKLVILNEEKNVEKIVEIMSKDEYFNKLVRNSSNE